MNLLSIDTTTKVAAVALKTNNKIYENSVSNEITHSEKLLPLISNILKNHRTSLKDIPIFCVINGPGSFTGIRIGLSTLKAFSYVNKQKIFSITSSMLLAYKAYEIFCVNHEFSKKYVISLIDAKNSRMYYDIYKIEKNENRKILIDELFEIKNDDIHELLKDVKSYLNENNINSNDIIIAGNTLSDYENDIKSIFSIEDLKLITCYPTPSDTINAFERFENPEKYIFDAFTLDAIYARKSQAERLKKSE